MIRKPSRPRLCTVPATSRLVSLSHVELTIIRFECSRCYHSWGIAWLALGRSAERRDVRRSQNCLKGAAEATVAIASSCFVFVCVGEDFVMKIQYLKELCTSCVAIFGPQWREQGGSRIVGDGRQLVFLLTSIFSATSLLWILAVGRPRILYRCWCRRSSWQTVLVDRLHMPPYSVLMECRFFCLKEVRRVWANSLLMFRFLIFTRTIKRRSNFVTVAQVLNKRSQWTVTTSFVHTGCKSKQ